MSIRGQIWAVLDVVLRVPPLFVMDAVLSCSLGLRHGSAVQPGVDVIKDSSDGSNSSTALLENDMFTHFDLPTLLWSFLYLQGKPSTVLQFIANVAVDECARIRGLALEYAYHI